MGKSERFAEQCYMKGGCDIFSNPHEGVKHEIMHFSGVYHQMTFDMSIPKHNLRDSPLQRTSPMIIRHVTNFD